MNVLKRLFKRGEDSETQAIQRDLSSTQKVSKETLSRIERLARRDFLQMQLELIQRQRR